MRVLNVHRDSTLAIEVELATSAWARFRGLMLRSPEHFQEGQALIIDPCTSIHMFFMRFPIDVVYLNRDNEVVRVQEAIRPWRMGALYTRGARFVIELPVGTIARTETSVGDKLRLEQAERSSLDRIAA